MKNKFETILVPIAHHPMTTRNPADEYPVIAFETPKKWEEWLEKQHTRSPGIWLRIYKKGSGIASID